ncbi:MAG: hypothetical protein HND44_23290 [Chloroflexi bacterium]|nr:hypothetical protein [Ardenticatenaceae bacterium]NOG37468.1 hypothetical protein [Chloroflexota bacterium]
MVPAPSYPEGLVEDVIWLPRAGINGRILEIGCGLTTLPFCLPVTITICWASSQAKD